jgi:hypothetical protein
MTTPVERHRTGTAYHEAGHAVIGCAHERAPPHGVSLQPTLRVNRGYHIRGDACCASQQTSAAYVGLGSECEELALSISCPLYPVSDRRADIRNRQLRATCGLMQCNKTAMYSITRRPTNVAGTVEAKRGLESDVTDWMAQTFT